MTDSPSPMAQAVPDVTTPTPFPGSITDVTGLRLGHHTDPRRPTGCSVVLCEAGAVGGVDVRGAAPGTRETDLLAPGNLVDQVHAVLLAGGSAFGLDAASGVMRWLRERGHGFPAGPVRVPIVPAAVLFDLWLGDPLVTPDADAGYAACEDAVAYAATLPTAPAAGDVAGGAGLAPRQGSIGAGMGCSVGKLYGPEFAMRGGIGTASIRSRGVTVAALVAVNAAGDVVDRRHGLLAGARRADGSGLRGITTCLAAGDWPAAMLAGSNTTIGIVATDARLDKAQAQRLAMAAHDGLARSIDPVHTAVDGDTMFALATGHTSTGAGDVVSPIVLQALAAEVTARAVVNALLHATALPGLPTALAQWRPVAH